MVDYQERQSSLHDIVIPPEVVIVGCGGVGTWLAIALALGGTKKFLLIDHDSIEAHNLNRLPYPPSCLGQSKVKVLRDFLLSLDRGIEAVAIDRRFEQAQGFLDAFGYAYLYCCTDNSKSQEQCFEACLQKKMYYRKIGYDGYSVTISSLPPPRWGEAQGGYQITPSWVGGAMVAASLGTLELQKEEANFDVREMLGRENS